MILGYIPIPKDEQAVLLHLLYEEQVELLHQHQTLPVVHHPLEEVTIIRLQVTVLTHLEEVLLLVRQTTTQVETAVPVVLVIPDHPQVAVALEADQVLVLQVEEGAKTT